MGFWKSAVKQAKGFGDLAGQTAVDITEGAFGGKTTAQRNAEYDRGIVQAEAAKTAAQIASEQEAKRKQAELAAQYEQAEGYVAAAKFSPEQQQLLQEQKRRAAGENLMSYQLAARQQQEAERQQKALAYARGYNPMAARGVEAQTAESRANIRNVAAVSAEQEKAAAQQDYNQMLQMQQQMQFAGEQAKKNFLMGNKELAEQQSASLASYKSALAEIDARRRAAEQARQSQLMTALVSTGAGILATVATGGNPAAGAAASTLTSAAMNRR